MDGEDYRKSRILLRFPRPRITRPRGSAMNALSNSPSYDVIIVGSGAGGAAAAHRLVLAGLNVLILEKGAPLPHDGSTLDTDRVVTRGEFLSKEPWIDGSGNPICPEEHFNLGGKTKWYGAAVLRYSPREFEPDIDYAARGWPIGYADLAPYYDEAERLLAVRTFDCEPGLKRILDNLSAGDAAWQSLPLPMALSPDILDNPKEATHFDGFASAANLKGDAQENFLKPIAGRPNLAVRTRAEVVELLPALPGSASIGSANIGGANIGGANIGGATVGGIKLASGEELRARAVLLAAGALHSPRLLRRYLAAGGSSELPTLNATGRNLKKHVLTALVAVSASRQSDLLRKTMITTHGAFPHSSVQPLGFDDALIATLIPKFVPRALARAIGRHAYGFFLQTEDGSHPDNRVTERPGRNGVPNGAQTAIRVMDYDATRTPASQREHGAFTRAFKRSLLRAGFLSFTQRIGLNGTAHVDGTLAAGTDPRDAVVDRNGAVFGIAGLYVVDGSILPRSSRVNPSLSIYAWGLRIGHLLAESLQAAR
jgi:choline dehydrogenase-like flavoprotein